MTYEDVFNRVKEIVYRELNSALYKDLWEPLTPEKIHDIEVMCREYFKSRGYDKLKLSSCKVICDESNNSPGDIENGVVNVTVIPSIERITVEFLPVKEGLGGAG